MPYLRLREEQIHEVDLSGFLGRGGTLFEETADGDRVAEHVAGGPGDGPGEEQGHHRPEQLAGIRQDPAVGLLQQGDVGMQMLPDQGLRAVPICTEEFQYLLPAHNSPIKDSTVSGNWIRPRDTGSSMPFST